MSYQPQQFNAPQFAEQPKSNFLLIFAMLIIIIAAGYYYYANYAQDAQDTQDTQDTQEQALSMSTIDSGSDSNTPASSTTNSTSSTIAAPVVSSSSTPPIVTPPVVTPPVVTQPVVTLPIVTLPIVTPPVVTQPVVTPPVVTPPVVTQPVVAQPVVTLPIVTPPVVTPPVVTPPVVTPPVPISMPTPKKCNDLILSDYPTIQSCLDVDNKTIQFADVNAVTDFIFSRNICKSNTICKSELNNPYCRLAIEKSDGNLVLYGKTGIIWSTGKDTTNGVGPFAFMLQENGNLVILDINGKIGWSSKTPDRGIGPYVLELTNDCYLQITDSIKNVIWKHTDPAIPKKCSEIVSSDYPVTQSCLDLYSKIIRFYNEKAVADLIKARSNLKNDTPFTGLETDNFVLVLQGDGNLVIYRKGGPPIWGSGSNGKGEGPFNLLLQSDGALVIYAKNGPIWGSGSNGKSVGPFNLELKPDGKLEITDSKNLVIWRT
jgi:hypothetical protein